VISKKQDDGAKRGKIVNPMKALRHGIRKSGGHVTRRDAKLSKGGQKEQK